MIQTKDTSEFINSKHVVDLQTSKVSSSYHQVHLTFSRLSCSFALQLTLRSTMTSNPTSLPTDVDFPNKPFPTNVSECVTNIIGCIKEGYTDNAALFSSLPKYLYNIGASKEIPENISKEVRKLFNFLLKMASAENTQIQKIVTKGRWFSGREEDIIFLRSYCFEQAMGLYDRTMGHTTQWWLQSADSTDELEKVMDTLESIAGKRFGREGGKKVKSIVDQYREVRQGLNDKRAPELEDTANIGKSPASSIPAER